MNERSAASAWPTAEIVDADGARYLVFKNKDMIGNLLRRQGAYEPEVVTAAKYLLSRQTDGVVLDIGANIGTFAIPLAKAFPTLQVESFEVQRVVYYQLCGNIILNAAANIRAHHQGLSDEASTIEIAAPDYSTERNVAAFSLDADVRRNDYECATVGQVETVTTCSVDSFKHTDVRLMKIDVEGLELRVLQGAVETLRASRFPPVIFEAWIAKPWFDARRDALFAFLKERGYDIFTHGNNHIAQHPAYGSYVKFEVRDDT